ncbi:MAG: DUF3795 domain-containing protein [Pseudomonadota bacterium]
MVDEKLLAPCGLYCGVCGVLIAHRANDLNFKERLAKVYGVAPTDLACEGCGSDIRPVFCQTCSYRDCASGKGYQGCHQCADFPCKMIDDFPIEVGKRVILRAIPAWRELGTEEYVAAEEKRYACPECGAPLFRGAKRCRSCRTPVNVDG